jgi:hypothetical protein
MLLVKNSETDPKMSVQKQRRAGCTEIILTPGWLRQEGVWGRLSYLVGFWLKNWKNNDNQLLEKESNKEYSKQLWKGKTKMKD